MFFVKTRCGLQVFLFVCVKDFFPFFARPSLSSVFWAWSFTLGVGSQFSQIVLGQFDFPGSFRHLPTPSPPLQTDGPMASVS